MQLQATNGARLALQYALGNKPSTATIQRRVDRNYFNSSQNSNVQITEHTQRNPIYAVQKKGSGKNAVYTIVELESETSVKPTTGKMYRSEAAALDAATAKGYTIYGSGTAEQLPDIYKQAQAEVAQANQRQNIDNTANAPYTNNTNGGAANDGNRMDSGMVDGVSKRQRTGTEVPRFGGLGRGYQELSREHLIRVKTALQASGVVATELQNFDADSTAFSNALNAARTADSKNGCAVTPQSVDELQGKQLYTVTACSPNSRATTVVLA